MTKKKTRVAQPSRMNWTFDSTIPTDDFFGGQSLDNSGDLQETVENFVFKMEEGGFLAWEAVVCHEQGLPLTDQQEVVLDDLISFDDSDDDQILYINEIPRPSESWHVILNKIVPHLLVEPFDTTKSHYDVTHERWKQLATCLDEHGEGLSLPDGAKCPMEVVPETLRHKLWLQTCFNALGGFASEDVAGESKDDAINWLIEDLRGCVESVQFLDLTPKSLLSRLILREKDRDVFVRVLCERLGMDSPDDQIADHLEQPKRRASIAD